MILRPKVKKNFRTSVRISGQHWNFRTFRTNFKISGQRSGLSIFELPLRLQNLWRREASLATAV